MIVTCVLLQMTNVRIFFEVAFSAFVFVYIHRCICIVLTDHRTDDFFIMENCKSLFVIVVVLYASGMLCFAMQKIYKPTAFGARMHSVFHIFSVLADIFLFCVALLVTL